MKSPNKRKLFLICFTVTLFLFTVWAALDTFLISRAFVVVEESAELESDDVTDLSSEENTSVETAVLTENTYTDDNIAIVISEYREYDTSIFVADILLSDISYLKTAFAENTYGKNITAQTSDIAAEKNAILAINGDFYGAQNNGYVIRNGKLYRASASGDFQEDLVVYSDGTFDVITESDISASALIDASALQVFSFGPGLVSDSEITVSNKEEVDKAKTSNPRTAIGMIDTLHYVMIVSDGRTDDSEGLTLFQLAEFMQSLGVTEAYNLDGGGSSTMVFNGEIINHPTTNGSKISERSVSDIVYIG